MYKSHLFLSSVDYHKYIYICVCLYVYFCNSTLQMCAAPCVHYMYIYMYKMYTVAIFALGSQARTSPFAHEM